MAHEKLRPRYVFDETKIEQIKQIAPECFEDGKINFETLKENLGNFSQNEEDPELEHFGLFWPGKRDARKAASLVPEGNLEPVFGDGLKAGGEPDTNGENNSKNIFIEGENLEVLKLLQKSYSGKIKMIYIDPPYNTGNDFVYDDDFTEPLQEYLRRTGQVDEEGKALTTNKRSDGRFHSKWLSMIYPRLRLARNLLKEDGVIFVSIDDNEVHNLRAIMNEIFGEENFVAQFVWNGGRKNDSKKVSVGHEYIICYEKIQREKTEESEFWRERKEGIDSIYNEYEKLKKVHGTDWLEISKQLKKWFSSLSEDESAKRHKHYNWADDVGVYFPSYLSGPDDGRKNRPRYEVLHPITKKPVPVPSRGWRWEKPRMEKELERNRVHFGENEESIPNSKVYLKENEYEAPSSVFYKDRRAASARLKKLLEDKLFDFPKDVEVIGRLIKLVSKEDTDIILDFFGGSGTTADSVLECNSVDGMNRKFIIVQFPEEIKEDSKIREKGFNTISQITSYRIKKTILSNKNKSGFKSLKLVGSNYKNWKNYNGTSVGDLEMKLALFNESPLVDDYTKDGLLMEIMLLEGFTLCSTISKLSELKTNAIKKITSEYSEHALLVCLDEKINKETVTKLELGDSDIFICLDSAISTEDKLRLSDKGLIKTI